MILLFRYDPYMEKESSQVIIYRERHTTIGKRSSHFINED